MKKKWTGREDFQGVERLFQLVDVVDRKIKLEQKVSQNTFGILGFSCDEGVRRNNGRCGAYEGPNALRSQMSNLCLEERSDLKILDFGDVTCDDQDLEKSQLSLANHIEELVQHKIRPLVLGGGHETAWGHFQGLKKYLQGKKWGIINFDAHFDLRPLLNGAQGSSGTPFRQIHQWCKDEGCDFNYLCLGIQKYANSKSLFNTARELNTSFLLAEELTHQHEIKALQLMDKFLDRCDYIYLSVCLDVFSASVAPGVSAPQAKGLYPFHFAPLYEHVLNSKKVLSLDIVELAPKFDLDARTAKLGAMLAMDYLMKSHAKI